MQYKAAAEHLAKRCLEKLDAVWYGSRAETEALRVHGHEVQEHVIVVTRPAFSDTLGDDAYMFAIRSHVLVPRGAGMAHRKLEWLANVYVTRHDVVVTGDAPGYIVDCVEASYTRL